MSKSFCRSCNADIVWFETTTGKKMPADWSEQTEEDAEDGELFNPKKHVSHFSTCPNANGHRQVKPSFQKAEIGDLCVFVYAGTRQACVAEVTETDDKGKITGALTLSGKEVPLDMVIDSRVGPQSKYNWDMEKIRKEIAGRRFASLNAAVTTLREYAV